MTATALRNSDTHGLAAPAQAQESRAPIAIAEDRMRAVLASGYGSPEVLTCTHRPKPVPADNEVLIRIYATNVTAADSMMRRGDPAYARLFLGLRKPKAEVPGTGLAGIVEAAGQDVDRLKVGEAVFGEAGLNFGAHAEYVCVPQDGVILPKPASLSFAEAAAICDGPMTSYNFLRRIADVKPGQRVLVNGASGALGTAAVQLAKSFGATVIGVCSAANVDLVKSLGADEVIDYNLEDFTKRRDSFDIIYDTVGKSSFGRCKRALTKQGSYLSPVLSLGLLLQMMRTALFSKKSAKFDATGLRKADELRDILTKLVSMAEEGKLRTVIERSYSLDQIREAHAHVDTGHKKGTIIIRVCGSDSL